MGHMWEIYGKKSGSIWEIDGNIWEIEIDGKMWEIWDIMRN